jgi:hypothetical protein
LTGRLTGVIKERPYKSAGVVAFAPVALAVPGFAVAGFLDAVAPVAFAAPGFDLALDVAA